MFSYPSGAKLHVGHWYNYGLSDIWARMKKMQGYEVFQPMGFDAFGLPAENYAIKTGIHPQDSTEQNISTMREQLRKMGGMFNWQHELATCKPEYYKWNQWLFLQLYKNGLAYRKNAPVNWCTKCNTVLANEQVSADHTCDRCGSSVIKKDLTQWFFKITDYAGELLDDLDQLDWPEKTKRIQHNWIGRSHGAEIVLDVEKNGEPLIKEGQPVQIRVFTTRADTLPGVTYVVVAPESDLCLELTTEQQMSEVMAYREQVASSSDIERMSTTAEKTGVFTGAYAIHPQTGKRVPVWTSDYVIASYGTGAVMAVPAHDERDYAFAEKFHLPIEQVIAAIDDDTVNLPYCEDGMVKAGCKYDGLTSAEAREQMVADLQAEGRGEQKINYRLRDWLVSRQRYWGTPIPIVYCDKCGVVPVPEKDLPVLLPYDVDFAPDGDSPLKKCDSFMHTTCPCCGGPALRDPDTLDTFVCSSWYQFRYVDNHNSEKAFDSAKVNQLCPVDKYIGGAEHAAMHLLYSRFITKVLRDLKYLDFDEPFLSLIHQGTILGEDGSKMSKSLGNTVSPDQYIEEYGADVFRLYLAFAFAYVDGGPWNSDGIKAISKFVNRIERLCENLLSELEQAGLSLSDLASEYSQLLPQYVFDLERDKRGEEQKLEASDQGLAAAGLELSSAMKKLNSVLNYTIASVSRDAEAFRFNTSIARVMELMNSLAEYRRETEKLTDADRTSALIFEYRVVCEMTRTLAPFAPHLCEELWQILGQQPSIFKVTWPIASAAAQVSDMIEIAVQINGKVLTRIDIPTDADQEQVMAIAHENSVVEERVADKTVRKVIYVPKRLLNIVVG